MILGVVAKVADRIAVMYAGKIIETGMKREIFYRPSHPYTRGSFKLYSSVRYERRTISSNRWYTT